jgi:exodeoxyribonuclease VII small subunit
MSQSPPPPPFSYEESLRKIHQIVQELQEGRTGFDDLLKRYHEASTLIDQCRAFLDQSELIIRKVAGGHEVDFH